MKSLFSFLTYFLIAVCGIQFSSSFCLANQIVLKNEVWTIRIQPGSLQVTAKPKGRPPIQISAPQENLGAVEGLRQNENSVSWEFPQKKISISFRVEGEELSANFHSQQTGTFTWPIVKDKKAITGYILPLFEGSYVPADDVEWSNFLTARSPMDTTEGLSMPFWGVDCSDYTLTYILTNSFNNGLVFENDGERLSVRFTHEFKRNWKKKEYGLLIRLGDVSLIEPAKQYREWLVESGQFVSMKDKIKNIPAAEKLLGAAHIYLWGNARVSRYDVLDWKGFAVEFKAQGEALEPSQGKWIWELMGPDVRKAVTEITTMEHPYDYIKNQVTDELSQLLARRDFYEKSIWYGVDLNDKAVELLNRRISDLTESEVMQLNSFLLEAAFPGQFIESRRWGNGISVKMLEKFTELGFDRLWLGLDSWQGGFLHPEAIAEAKALGYLIGPYDSYHSIHHPDEEDTWETAQFDLQLYETGAIVRADGTKKRGFKQKGYNLSPIAARPYVEKRVNGLMAELRHPFNSWFIDCDAYGELFDDYSELHPATQADGMQARLDRMAWIRDTYKTIIGSEGGVAYSAATIHFAHGMMTPVIGWGDLDLQKNKKSEYYLGGYWPPDGPAIQIKQVPLKEKYYRFYYDSRFRLPLYQTVFHDSVIATHHWGYASLKFKDQVDTVALLELLYNVPPLYNLNLKELAKHKTRIKAQYDFFSPLHRELALLPLTDFAWLTPDRMVQRTIFGGAIEMVANFGVADFDYQGKLIPKRSILAKWRNTGKMLLFTPSQSKISEKL